MKTQRVARSMATKRAPRGLVGHLRQIFDVDVDEAWFVVLEGFLRCDRFSLGLRDHILQARHTFALEKAGDARAGRIGVDVLLRDEHQIIER
jgi:hypothetical protein